MPELAAQLSMLEQSGLIAIAKLLPDLEYLFRHVLVQDVAYDTLIRRDRRRLHLAVGEVLEATHADQPEHAATLAHHFHQAEEMERARHYYWIAGETAIANYANAEAQQHFRAALTLSTTDDQRLQALIQLGTALHKGGSLAESFPIYREAIELAYQLGDCNQMGRVYAALSDAMWYQGDVREALAVCREGLARFEGMPDSEGLARLLSQMASVGYFNGMGSEGIESAHRAQAIAVDLGLVELQADNLITLGMLYSAHDSAASISYYREGVELAETHRLLRTAGRGHVNFGVILSSLGEFAEASRQALRGREIAIQLGDLSIEMVATLNTIESCLWLGQLDEADFLIEAELNAPQASMQPAWALAGLEAYRGIVACQRGQWDEGFKFLRPHLEEARQAGNLQMIGIAGTFFADFLAQGRQFEEAERLLLEVIPLIDQALGSGPIYPRCVLVGLYAEQGRIAEAHQWLEEAQSIAQRAGYPLASGDLLLAQGRLAAAEHRWQEAIVAYAAADQWCDQRSLRPSQGQIRLGWADALLQLGERQQAMAMFNQARDLYAAMGADGYVALVDQRQDEAAHKKSVKSV